MNRGGGLGWAGPVAEQTILTMLTSMSMSMSLSLPNG